MTLRSSETVSVRRTNGAGRAVVCVAASPCAAALTDLGPGERVRLEGMKLARQRDAFRVGRHCAKTALADLAGTTVALLDCEIETGALGQPVVRSTSPRAGSVSISHCAAWGAAVAFDEAFPMGVDIESIDAVRDAGGRNWATPHEQELWIDRGGPDAAAILWSAKEAVSKLLRTGLDAPPALFEVCAMDREEGGVRLRFARLSFVDVWVACGAGHVLALAYVRGSLLQADLARLGERAFGPSVASVASAVLARRPVVFMFPGQGSQYRQMGRELFEQDATFATAIRRGAECVRRFSGRDLLDEIYSPRFGKFDPFDELALTHPAIVVMGYALGQCLLARGIEPDLLLGASLGEFTAAAFSGVLPLEDVLRLVIEQSRIVERVCPRGGMIAILARPEIFDEEPEFSRLSELVGVNFDGHFVVSALAEPLDELVRFLNARKIRHQVLPVRYPFHSRAMDSLEPVWRDLLSGVRVSPARWPILSCATAAVVRDGDLQHFAKIVREPIRFRESVKSLVEDREPIFIDVGPSGTLASYVKYALPPDSPARHVAAMTPFGNDQRSIGQVLEVLRTTSKASAGEGNRTPH